MSTFLSAALSGITKQAEFYSNRLFTSEDQAKELADKVKSYSLREAKELMKQGVNPNAASIRGKNLLIYSVIEENDAFIEPLVKYGININAKDSKEKQSLLSLENILIALVKKGMDRQEAHEVLRKNKWEGEKVALELGLNLDELIACQKPNIGRSKEQVDLFLRQSIDPMLEEYKDLKCPDYLIHL